MPVSYQCHPPLATPPLPLVALSCGSTGTRGGGRGGRREGRRRSAAKKLHPSRWAAIPIVPAAIARRRLSVTSVEHAGRSPLNGTCTRGASKTARPHPVAAAPPPPPRRLSPTRPSSSAAPPPRYAPGTAHHAYPCSEGDEGGGEGEGRLRHRTIGQPLYRRGVGGRLPATAAAARPQLSAAVAPPPSPRLVAVTVRLVGALGVRPASLARLFYSEGKSFSSFVASL